MSTSNDRDSRKLCACVLALAVGIVWGVGLLVLGILTTFSDVYGHKVVDLLGNVYYGYQSGSFGRALLGLAWGFADGFICTFIVVALYNLLVDRCGRCCMRKAEEAESAAGGGI